MKRSWGKTVVLLVGPLLLLAGCKTSLQSPVASFSLTPTDGISPLVVTFDATASFAPGGSIVQYAWDFGDGERATGVAAAHAFTADVETTFFVDLTITDNHGAQATATAQVHVVPPAVQPKPVSVGFTWPFHFDASGDDAANLNDEYFTLINTGAQSVDLSGWTVETEDGKQYLLPNGFVLSPGSVVTIHSGAGADTASILHWNSDRPVWNDVSGIAILYDEQGQIVDIYPYNSC